MKEKDLISIIMSTSNTKKEYLEIAINSILKQTYKNFEFLIINDGGNDIEYLQKLKDKRIKIIKHEKRLGLAKGLNEAIKIAKGKYIARMDSDDYSFPKRIEKQYKFMKKHKNIDITSGFAKEFDDSSDFLFNVWKSERDLQSQLFFTNILIHPSVMIRKEFLIENNLKYSEEFMYSQDFELWTRINKNGKIAIIPQILVLYRIHKNQVSLEKKDKQKELYEIVLKRNLKELEMDESNIEYIEILNGYKKEKDLPELYKFINKSIEQNDKIKIYNNKSFKKVLYNRYDNILLKENKKYFFKYILKINNIIYMFLKVYFEFKIRIMYLKNKKGEII